MGCSLTRPVDNTKSNDINRSSPIAPQSKKKLSQSKDSQHKIDPNQGSKSSKQQPQSNTNNIKSKNLNKQDESSINSDTESNNSKQETESNNSTNSIINQNEKEYSSDSSNSELSNHPSLSPKEQEMAKIAQENQEYILTNKPEIGTTEYIDDDKHIEIDQILQTREKPYKNTWIYVNNTSTIETAINCHQYNQIHQKPLKICLLNFADALKPGGGYLNGRSPQEETLCRQTLLYPTLTSEEGLIMYEKNRKIENFSIEHDSMVYSKNVEVIRDDSYEMITDKFYVDVISSPAFDNRHNFGENSDEIMERRIRKIIKLAAFENDEVLILGAFGCGIFKNDPYEISHIFRKILINEGLKDYFQSVWFPIFKSERNFNIFKKTFTNHKKNY